MNRPEPRAGDDSPNDATAALRRGVYLILIAIAAGTSVGRIFAVNAVDNARLETYLQSQGRADWQKQRPFLSGNDRSRWATARALVEHGTYAIDDIVSQPNWDTLDMVKHDGHGRAAPKADEGHLYSSKPPLFPTLMAGEYWVIHKLTGWTLGDHPYEIGRFMLVTINVIPLVIGFAAVASMVDRFGASDWGRVFAVATITLGTFLNTFVVVINNHLIGAVSAAIALWGALRIWYDGRREWRYYALSGLFAAFAAANELPALAFFVAITVGLLWKSPWRTLVGFVPPALLVTAAALGTNYLAHGTPIPAYAQRGEANNWYDYQYMRDGKVRTSYWSEPALRSEVDQGEPSSAVYALHALVGHHGIFSLTPVWLLSAFGLVALCVGRRPDHRALGVLLLSVSVVVVVFFLSRPQDDRNYGGMSSGFRWVFWLAPLWVVGMLPAVDWLARRTWGRVVAAMLLGLSALSAAYPTWNPWTHPWLLNYLLYLDAVELGIR